MKNTILAQQLNQLVKCTKVWPEFSIYNYSRVDLVDLGFKKQIVITNNESDKKSISIAIDCYIEDYDIIKEKNMFPGVFDTVQLVKILKINNHNVTVNADGIKAGIITIKPVNQNVLDYPEINLHGLITKPGDEINGGLHAALLSARDYMANQDVRYYLNGLLIDKSNVVATDGHRLYQEAVPGMSEDRIIPDFVINQIALLKMDKDTIRFKEYENGFQVSDGTFTIKSDYIDGRYPNWQAALPEKNKPFVINSDDILNGIKKISPALNSKFAGMRVSKNKLYCENEAGLSAEYELNQDYPITEKIGFNATYIDSAIKTLNKRDKTDITLDYRSANDSVVFRKQNINIVVMPVRL